MKLSKYILEITVFTSGAVVMIFELVGSRVLGPFFGTSIFVWTSLIGIILGSLSLGYYLGGKIADNKPSFTKLSFIIFISAVFIFITFFIKDFILIFLQSNISDIRTSSVIASIVLFSPTSVFLGIVSPYAAKLKLNNLDTSGSTIGNLYALSTAGSIIGTFLSGFYLIPNFGTNKLLIILAIVLILISILLSFKQLLKIKFSFFIFVTIFYFLIGDLNLVFKDMIFVDTDTAYNRVWIYDRYSEEYQENIRTMSINNESSSAMFLDSDKLVYEYTKYYHLAKHFNPDFKTTLMLGGAGYSYPKNFLLKYPEATIDVIEIDPELTELAKQYFNLKDDLRLNIYHEDGRSFLNTTQKKYDAIFGDAFSSQYSVPYQLTTLEAVQKNYDILNNNGVVVLNIISSIEGKDGQFLRAEYTTYKNIFEQVFLFPVRYKDEGSQKQNIILVALKSNKDQVFTNINPEINEYLQHLWTKEIPSDMPILTDDYAPVDYYISQMI